MKRKGRIQGGEKWGQYQHIVTHTKLERMVCVAIKHKQVPPPLHNPTPKSANVKRLLLMYLYSNAKHEVLKTTSVVRISPNISTMAE